MTALIRRETLVRPLKAVPSIRTILLGAVSHHGNPTILAVISRSLSTFLLISLVDDCHHLLETSLFVADA